MIDFHQFLKSGCLSSVVRFNIAVFKSWRRNAKLGTYVLLGHQELSLLSLGPFTHKLRTFCWWKTLPEYQPKVMRNLNPN